MTSADTAAVIDVARASGQKQFLVDISGLILRDDQTGVHRVVRSLLTELMLAPPSGFEVLPIHIDSGGQFRYAREWVTRDGSIAHSHEPTVSVHRGDVYFTADLYYPYPFRVLQYYAQYGLQIIFTVHDIIPLRYPEYFMKFSHLALREWLEGVVQNASGIVCVSRAVADEVREWISAHQQLRSSPLPIGYFHHGADLERSGRIENQISQSFEMPLEQLIKPTFLMVGTMLPYKGYSQALYAFESLWSSGLDCNLVVVGKEGWRANRLADRFRHHKETGKRVFWFEKATDRQLVDLYQSASCLIAASQAEGFGLPLIEAARYQLPIIARDIPVFREIAGGHAFFFRGDSPEVLSNAVQNWLQLRSSRQVPQSDGMRWQTWKQSKDQLLNVILNGNWYATA